MDWKSNEYLYTKIDEFTNLYLDFIFRKIDEFCGLMNISVIPYTPRNRECMSISPDGFSFFENGEYSIFYNKAKHIHRIRFTLAHELGHIYLGHHSEIPPSIFRYHKIESSICERQANIFAHNILLPVSYAQCLQYHGIKEIAKTFNLSTQMLTVRYAKLEEDIYWLNKIKLHSPDEAEIDKVGKLKKGDTVTVNGEIKGKSLNVEVENCKIVK